MSLRGVDRLNDEAISTLDRHAPLAMTNKFMDFTNDITKVKGLLETAQDILIVTHENPTHDSIGSALALYLGLTSLGKKVTIACPDPMIVELSNYIGAQKVVNVLSKKNFVISLDYVEGSIEKVSYNIEGNKFNLVIEPRPGFDSFGEDKVHYAHTGQSAQLIFSVDTIHLGGLKKLFEDDKDLYASKPIINIDRHVNNARYGHTNMIDETATSTAEVVFALLSGLGVAITEDIATNLLNAVYAATQNFQLQSIKASAFELAGKAITAGGKRFGTPKPSEEITHGGESVTAEPQKIEHDAMTPVASIAPVLSEHPVTEKTLSPMLQHTPQSETQHLAQPENSAPKQQKAPPDWLKPKIFKSSNIS